MAEYGYVYKTTNLKEGKVYIGQNKGKFIPNYYGSGRYLKSAIKKHGKQSFKLEVVCYLPNKEQLDEFETFLILKYREILGRDKTYNITDGGEFRYGTHNVECKCCSCKNKRGELIYTEERNKKISETKKKMARKGLYHHSEEVKEKIRLAGVGRNPSQETKNKMRLSNIGRKLSEEHKKIISEAQKNRIHFPHSDETKEKCRQSFLRHKSDCKCPPCVNIRNKNVCKC